MGLGQGLEEHQPQPAEQPWGRNAQGVGIWRPRMGDRLLVVCSGGSLTLHRPPPGKPHVKGRGSEMK